MNEITKSSTNVLKSIGESEIVIKSNENFVGMGLWNIGNELKYIRDNKTYVDKNYKSFEDYVENVLDYSRSQTYNFLSIAESYNVQSIGQIGHLGMVKLLTLSKISEPLREKFIQDNNVDAMSTRELQKAIKDRDEALKTLEDARKISIKSSEDARNMFEGKMKAESDLRTVRDVLTDAQKDYKALQVVLQREKDSAKETIEHLEKSITQTKKQLSEAKVSGNDEDVERLKASLQESQNDLDTSAQRIDELEEKLKDKPIDITETVIEKIPEEVEKELQELRQKASQNNNQSVVKFSVYFDELVKNFQNLLGALDIIDNVEVHEKYKNAVNGLINKMSERL